MSCFSVFKADGFDQDSNGQCHNEPLLVCYSGLALLLCEDI